jgi:IS5 family transposase
LSIRWYLGYDLHEPLPDHSSLTRIRKRYGLDIFRRFFERIVQICFEAGLVRGKDLFFDATKVRANADVDSLCSRSLEENHLDGLSSRKKSSDRTPELLVGRIALSRVALVQEPLT